MCTNRASGNSSRSIRIRAVLAGDFKISGRWYLNESLRTNPTSADFHSATSSRVAARNVRQRRNLLSPAEY